MYRQRFWHLQNVLSIIPIIAQIVASYIMYGVIFSTFNIINIIKYYLLKNYKGGYTHLVSKYQGVSFICVDWLSRIFMDNHTSVFIKFEYLNPDSIHDRCIDDACCILARLIFLILRRWPIKDVTKEFEKTIATILVLCLFQT